jgi:hypothetical protein
MTSKTRAGRPVARRCGGRGSRVGGLTLATIILATLAVGCSAVPSPTATAGSTAAISAGPTGPNPNATPWPIEVVESSIALGAADGGFAVMTDDLASAVSSGEPARILDVIGRVIPFLQENQKNIPRLQAYAFTKAVGDRLAAAYQQMIDGAIQIQNSLKSGDGAAVTAGFSAFFAGNTAYGDVRSALGDVASQAVFMKKGLLK